MKIIKFIIILAVITGIAVVSQNKSRKPEIKKNLSQVESNPKKDSTEQKAYTFSIDGKTTKGVKKWHLEGTTAEMMGDEIQLGQLNAIAFGEEFSAKLVSDKGIYYRDKSLVELVGNVKVTTDEGTLLTTDSAQWSQETREITTDSIVTIVRSNMRAEGKGAIADSFKKIAKLIKNVRVAMEPSTIVYCDGPMDVNFGDNVAIFQNNVKVRDKDGELFADKLTVSFSKETKKIAEVRAKGNVKLVRGKSYTLCEEAIYTDGTRSVQFLGKPTIVIAPEEIKSSGVFTTGGFNMGNLGKR
ncbi:secreted protein containing DUF1239 [Candidatus Omnitrophus magneticus]|uniref:Secreted protein containing DUF1239 n=1 Tax=Candidatus Omnitrophus magneticus TaxID=1609969 RepID=A0A0F0CKH5_9BACT|nr:secreted protein containing DUF1239 [Candidatus Omnitrophus magneticus]